MSHVCDVVTIVPPSCIVSIRANMGYAVIVPPSCIVSFITHVRSRHLVFWSLGTLTSLRDRVRGLLRKGKVLTPQIRST
jgi:hypothetical protein